MHKLAGSFFNRHTVEAEASSIHCKHTVSELFHSPLGVLFTFPSRYWFTIGLQIYLALGVSTPGFTQATRVLGYSGMTTKEMSCFRVQDYYLLGSYFPVGSTNNLFFDSSNTSTTPSPYNPGRIAQSAILEYEGFV